MVMDCCTPYLKNIQFTHSSEIGHNVTCSMCEIQAKIWPIFFLIATCSLMCSFSFCLWSVDDHTNVTLCLIHN